MLESGEFYERINESQLQFTVDFGMNYAKLEQRSNALLEQNRLFEINLNELAQECS